MPSMVKSVTPPPLSSYVRVTLCGGGPGSNVGCATFSFQVPVLGTFSCAAGLTPETTSVKTTQNVSVRSSDCIVLLLPDIALPNSFSLLNDDCPTRLHAARHRFHLPLETPNAQSVSARLWHISQTMRPHPISVRER